MNEPREPYAGLVALIESEQVPTEGVVLTPEHLLRAFEGATRPEELACLAWLLEAFFGPLQ